MNRSDLEAIIKLGNESYKNGMEAMDEKWRAAVERVREEYAAYREPFSPSTILDALLAAMEVPYDGQ